MNRAGRRAFSLIELLVVVGIIGLLVAMAVPGLSKARSVAREMVCATQLRTWGQAFLLYAGNHDGTIPHTDDRQRNDDPNLFDAKDAAHECCYIDLLPPLMGRPAWRSFPEGSRPTGDIWQCPEARLPADAAYSPQYHPEVQGYHSFAMNSYLEYDFPYGESLGLPVFPSFLKIERARAPSQTILMFEQTLDPRKGYGQKGGHPMAGRYTAEDARALSERHAHLIGGLGGNTVMLDSHVEWRNNLWDKSLNNPRIPRREDLTWFPY